MTVWEKLYKDRQTKDSLFRTIQELQERFEENRILSLHQKSKETLSRRKRPSEFFLARAEERREIKRKEYDDLATPQFKPTILDSSRKLASVKRPPGVTVYDRLYSSRHKESKEEPIHVSQARSAVSQSGLSFIERQRMYDESRKLKEKIRSRRAYDECPFKPQISAKSEEIALQRGRDHDVVNRLAVEDLKSRLVNQETRVMQADPECRFVPEINSLSDALATMKRTFENASVHDRLHMLTSRTSSEATTSSETENRVEKQQRRRTNSAYSHVRSHYNLRNPDLTLAAIDNARRHRESARKDALRQRTEQELAACTFQPKVNKVKQHTRQGPVLVPGLDKFIANQDFGRRLSETGRLVGLREFVSPDYDGTLTVPQPFILSGTSDD